MLIFLFIPCVSVTFKIDKLSTNANNLRNPLFYQLKLAFANENINVCIIHQRSVKGTPIHVISKDIIDSGNEAGVNFVEGKAGYRVISGWFRGKNIPCSKRSKHRLAFVERFFDLPEGGLVRLLPNSVSWGGNGRPANPPSTLPKEKRPQKLNNKLDALPPGLEGYFNEYSEFRLKGKQPKITIYPEKLKGNRRAIRDFNVEEEGVRGGKWTVNANGMCRTKDAFRSNLITYSSYLVHEKNIPLEEITTSHLTDFDLLEDWVDFQCDREIGGGTVQRVLIQIGTSSRTSNGYFRLCGELGDRTYEEYQSDLDQINHHIDKSWLDRLEDSIATRDPKANIRFLTRLPYEEARSVINDSTRYLFNQAKILTHGKNNKPLAKHRLLETDARSAYLRSLVAVICQISMVQPIRQQNLADLRYFSSDNASNNHVPSIVWLRSEQRYRLFIPKSFLKNRAGKRTNDINCLLPPYLTPIIGTYLQFRDIFIDRCIKSVVPDAEPERFFPYISQGKGTQSSIESGFVIKGALLGSTFKRLTWIACLEVRPDINQQGINIHATRHLAATMFLNEHEGNFSALAILLNDTLEVVLQTYGELDYDKQMNKIVNWAQDKQQGFEL